MELQRRCDKIVRSIESEKDPEKCAAIYYKTPTRKKYLKYNTGNC